MVSFLKFTVIVALASIAMTKRTQVDERIAAMSGTRIRGVLTNSSIDEAKPKRDRADDRIAAMSVTSRRDGLTNSSFDGTESLNSATQLAVNGEVRVGGRSAFNPHPVLSLAASMQLNEKNLLGQGDKTMAHSRLEYIEFQKKRAASILNWDANLDLPKDTDYSKFAERRAERLAESVDMPKDTFADHKKSVEMRNARLAASGDLPTETLDDYLKFVERRRARLARTDDVPKDTVEDYLKSVGRRAARLAEPRAENDSTPGWLGKVFKNKQAVLEKEANAIDASSDGWFGNLWKKKPAVLKSTRRFWNSVKDTIGARFTKQNLDDDLDEAILTSTDNDIDSFQEEIDKLLGDHMRAAQTRHK